MFGTRGPYSALRAEAVGTPGLDTADNQVNWCPWLPSGMRGSARTLLSAMVLKVTNLSPNGYSVSMLLRLSVEHCNAFMHAKLQLEVYNTASQKLYKAKQNIA